MRGNIGQLMKQAQMMQENMRRMQEQLAAMERTGSPANACKHAASSDRREVRAFGECLSCQATSCRSRLVKDESRIRLFMRSVATPKPQKSSVKPNIVENKIPINP